MEKRNTITDEQEFLIATERNALFLAADELRAKQLPLCIREFNSYAPKKVFKPYRISEEA